MSESLRAGRQEFEQGWPTRPSGGHERPARSRPGRRGMMAPPPSCPPQGGHATRRGRLAPAECASLAACTVSTSTVPSSRIASRNRLPSVWLNQRRSRMETLQPASQPPDARASCPRHPRSLSRMKMVKASPAADTATAGGPADSRPGAERHKMSFENLPLYSRRISQWNGFEQHPVASRPGRVHGRATRGGITCATLTRTGMLNTALRDEPAVAPGAATTLTSPKTILSQRSESRLESIHTISLRYPTHARMDHERAQIFRPRTCQLGPLKRLSHYLSWF
ncbi:hypothetical protein Pan189_00870 [Stratiformator vulcanicus]|uniref:Uncharacterized protein n=1 Tax=Stratiformator vulcanicus TaxID=2527980 RepID=A0A517QVW6_9PLAN|nr:hypothetical protein Pan189_00870 [Stratiformator vulcanicus]